MSDTRSRPDETMDDAPRPFKKRAYGYSCLPCRETNTVCMAAGRKAPKKRDPVAETQRMDDFERRLRRLEALAKVSSRSRSRTPPQKISSAPRTQQPSWASSNPDHEDELGRPQYDLGSAARPVYHGELSMFDEPDQRGSLDAPASSSPLFEGGSPQSWTEDQLRAAARLRHRYAKAEEGEVWVDAYFSWASPVYAVVHRPIFIRDMALDGPYFSDFLLIIIYITGIRLTYGMDERERIFKGEQFVSLAMNMLAEETMGPPRIPTIQALIGLAGRQSAVGKTNQAWMLTGMAIRMMQEMGLHLPVEDDSRFSPEDRDMRIRLFWSGSGVDILLIRTGNAFIREEAIQRVHLSLDILEQASSQGPGIKRGIMTIRTQLDLATKDDRTVKDLAQPASVEQTMGSALPQQQASTSTWLQADVSLDGALWDHQLLLDMLDSAPISTENPFSFGHGSNDGLWAL
ncbi:uncharacterized protein CcaverHIS019_0500100 [Cutaneotrichosporon cavernicola]|uniref:Xylanolytic transcriptional activator regulatory domain-containing protein n=1 Tax=Cutaneotrichosporon cavernicola TaxID=279322 RepID=A0AA48L5L4_9TREE|nr:uncharacterized protein CcaverHIS019_0500100 [Cutaneotrichosporon cavernicola]BEI92382.1 hypothetical protein CcaverHIS019_0500100 [Cutaneotrichosporon cavernicola]